jgi:hypothetical protein
MATKQPPIDNTERDLASAQLDELALRYDDFPWTVWKDAVLDWHLQRFATARSEAWLPGFAGDHHDPFVRKLVSRYHRHHMHVAIQRLRAENVALRRKLIDAAECARFYAGRASDNGERAAALLRLLRSPEASVPPGGPLRGEARAPSHMSPARYGGMHGHIQRAG